ncbi:NAD(P)H-dependent oxidoreductase [Candidatus Woesearchaeota archaeon]|nr:NAD(P)H-dependent oxidoreductase [Candidatus Woesearchaeota archaeon]
MNTLVIYAHPGLDGHNSFMLATIRAELDAKKVDYEVIDLYYDNFNPVLSKEEHFSNKHAELPKDVKKYQKRISEARKLIFVYPVWWSGVPAILKGFFDRVFTAGYAFKYDKGRPIQLLTGKKAAVFATSGAPRMMLKIFMGDRAVKTVVHDTLGFCGIKANGFVMGDAYPANLERNKPEMKKLVHRGISWLY